jgi:hypothetical protein
MHNVKTSIILLIYHRHKLSEHIKFHLGLILVLKVFSLIWSSNYLDAQIRRLFYIDVGALGSVVVEALCYKPEGRGIEYR